MKRIIFTSFDDIEKIGDNDNANFLLVKEYFDRLVSNKEEYAKSIGVDFKFFYNTMKDFDIPNELEFTKVNLYKHHLMAQLAEKYDEIMYVDMDVLFNTNENVFEAHDLNKGIHIKDQDFQIVAKDNKELLLIKIGLRSPTLKYHITKDMLGGKDNHVINTGVIIGKSSHIKQIKFVERLPDMISLLQNIKDNNVNASDTSYIRTLYYANNEAFFSYILENYNIPYVILNDEWHFFYSNCPSDHVGLEGKLLHFINKKFNRFFNDKTKAIFSLYVKIDDDKLDSPPTSRLEPIGNKSKRTQMQFEKYYDDLVKDKQEYAQNIGADFILFENDDRYKEFRKRFPTLSEYDIINLYKIYCLGELTKQYDLVCYLDFDVYCRRKDVDIFENVPCEYAVCCEFKPKHELGINHNSTEYFNSFIIDFRSPHAKYWNAHALLSEEGIEPDFPVFNTGIIAASRRVMEQMDYFGDIDEVIQKMKELKEDEFSMYPEKIRLSFGYDNESIFGYKVKKNNLLTYNLWNPLWHGKHSLRHAEAYDDEIRITTFKGKLVERDFKVWCREKNPVFIHFISKQFGLIFNK